MVVLRQLRARRALSKFIDVPLRNRRALSLYKVIVIPLIDFWIVAGPGKISPTESGNGKRWSNVKEQVIMHLKLWLSSSQNFNPRSKSLLKWGYTPPPRIPQLLWKHPLLFLFQLGIVAHEIGHAIGFHHEQSRPDRDDHVTIHLENILSHTTSNFDKYTWDEVTTEEVPYDVGSVMHYSTHVRFCLLVCFMKRWKVWRCS